MPHPPPAGPLDSAYVEHLAGALRAGAAGLYSLEAACDLVISTGWLRRGDFTRFISTGTSLSDGVTEMAHIDWQAVITSRETGLLPCSSSENRVLRLAASIADGIPVSLSDTLPGIDRRNASLVVSAVAHAAGLPDP